MAGLLKGKVSYPVINNNIKFDKATVGDAMSKEEVFEGEEEKGSVENIESKPKFRAGDFELNILKEQWRNKSQAELKGEIEGQLKEQGLSDAPAEFIDQLVQNVSRDLSKRTRWENLKSFFSLTLMASMVVVVVSFLSVMYQAADKYVPREELRRALTNAIANSTDIDDIKLVYQYEVNNPSETIWSLIKPHLFYERSTLTLLQVLNDLKVSKLTSDKSLEAKESEFVSQVNALVLEHNKVNPFDGLDEQSLRNFRGISYKLTRDEYEKIKDELLNLNSAIKQKNNIITQYLGSSNLSLYVSVGAFGFSILVTLWQFLPSRRSSQKQLISEVMKEHMAKR